MGLTRRTLALRAAATGAVSGLALLSGGAAAAATRGSGKITITFRAWTSSNTNLRTEGEVMQRAVEPYMRKHPGVHIQVIPQGDTIGDVMSAILAGQGPDVYHSWHPQSVFSNPAFAVDLTPYVKQYNADLSVFNQAQLQVFQQPRGLLALPYYLGTYAATLNLGLFDQAGVSYPDPQWDYKEYEKLARALSHKAQGTQKQVWGGSIGLGWMGAPPNDGTNDPFVPPFIAWGFGGGSYVDPTDPARCVADSEATVKANEWAWNLANDGVVANAGAWWSFTSNQYAIIPGPSFFLTMAATGFRSLKWDFWPMPTFPNGPATGATEDMTVLNPNCRHKDVAWDFMYWLAFQPDWQRAQMRIYLLSPALTSLWDEWVEVVKTTAPPLATKNIAAFATMAKENHAFPKQIFAYEAVQADAIFGTWGQKIAAKQVSVRQGLAQITKQVNALEAEGPTLAAQSLARERTIFAELARAQAAAAAITFPAPPQLDAGQPAAKLQPKWVVVGLGGTYTITGTGQGMHREADSGSFACAPYRPSRGTFTCRIVAINSVNKNYIGDGCKVGLMARSSLGDAAAGVLLAYSTGHGVHLQTRPLANVGAGDQHDGSSPGLPSRSMFSVNDWGPAKNYLPAPLWLRLVMDAARWTAYTSTDGKVWKQGPTVTIDMAGCWIGLFVNSNTGWSPGMEIKATFDHVTGFTPTTYVQIGTP